MKDPFKNKLINERRNVTKNIRCLFILLILILLLFFFFFFYVNRICHTSAKINPTSLIEMQKTIKC